MHSSYKGCIGMLLHWSSLLAGNWMLVACASELGTASTDVSQMLGKVHKRWSALTVADPQQD